MLVIPPAVSVHQRIIRVLVDSELALHRARAVSRELQQELTAAESEADRERLAGQIAELSKLIAEMRSAKGTASEHLFAGQS